MKPTIRDIATACGVSKTTVSRFLNKSGYVSKEVADKITAKIEELNYIPSSTARNLSLRRSNVIGLIVPEVNNPFFGQIFKGISKIADQEQMSILYCDTDNNRDKELRAFETLRGHNICGLIVTPATGGLINGQVDEEFIKGLKAFDVPIVLLDRDVEHVSWPGVFTDNVKGAYDATKLLIDQGHKKIATISGDQGLLIGKQRLLGYEKAMKEAGLYDESLIYEGNFSIEMGYKRSLEILKTDITAVFSPNNLTSMGLLKALQEKSLTMPEDLAVVGFDDIELLSLLGLNLTVVQRNPGVLGQKAIQLLLSLIKDGQVEIEKIILEAQIVTRGSEKRINMAD
ncbi:LacI family transcriptional regulator [Acidaminobacter sp. JC074]|uniref:LacI family DNA-binding transcriptional regulator n=1 Tax=Acidaminobacter sp. JC074 TaxID=2530199 RepID=UPI001F0DB709|nr:LacI family DNA-binding transcriptional regulator [Acidaminobacter sp. JC074]MCH4890094.1 LacI family transcriptional regulator [Acidaminobacter sp. JC074]